LSHSSGFPMQLASSSHSYFSPEGCTQNVDPGLRVATVPRRSDICGTFPMRSRACVRRTLERASFRFSANDFV
jgi:hypothetical protein